MKTSVDIPDKALRNLLKHTGAKTKREAILAAISDFNRRRELQKLSKHLGSFTHFMSQSDLAQMREHKKWQKSS